MRVQLAARRVPVALALFLLVTLGAPAHAADGTFTDQRTGLTWVADRDFAIHVGHAPATVLGRPRALRLIAAMNRGEIENFGRRDWRLPTPREIATRAPQRDSAPALARNLALVWPVSGSASLAGIGEVAILATNSTQVAKNSSVVGNVVVNDAAPGATLQTGVELAVNTQTQVNGAVAANRLKLDQGSVVSGDASYNTKQGSGSISGTVHTPLALPVFALLPAFHTAAPRVGSPDVTVAANETRTLPPGDYGLLDVAQTGTLILSGGQYDVRGVVLHATSPCTAPCVSLLFAGPTDLRLVERFEAATGSLIAPQGAGVEASSIVIYVGGINGGSGALGATPPAAHCGRSSTLRATLYAPNGSVLIDRDSIVDGALFGRDVRVDQGGTVTQASFFANRPPIAHPQTVTTSGQTPIVITLTGEDPEHADLRFSIVSGPSFGSLGAVVEGPEPTGDCERPEDPETCVPNRTEATVTYTPATGDNLEDSFVFKVTDPPGAVGVATVRINPPGQETPPPPPPTTVVVPDLAVTAFRDRSVIVTLTGGAPNGVELTFTIVPDSGPASGTLSDLVPGTEAPRRSSATTYTPAIGFLGNDAFQFEACGVIGMTNVCDIGNVVITVVEPSVEPTELAPDLTAETVENRAVQIVLGGGSSTANAPLAERESSARLLPVAAFLDGAEIAGNVADSDANGLGDNHNALPGPAPIFVSAAVGQSGGPGSSGTARIHMEWDVSSLGAGNLVSARVILHTNRGTIDTLDTSFFAGSGGNGTLEDGDFQANLEAVGATMPVPSLSEQPIGGDGTFTFDVRGELVAALQAGATFFTVQGRVLETTAGAARGLQVRSTASDNLASFLEPQLEITTPGSTPPTVFEVLTLPLYGVLRDSFGTVIDAPIELADARVTYTPNQSFSGDDSFSYQATFGTVVDTGLVFLHIRAGDCARDPEFCDDGR